MRKFKLIKNYPDSYRKVGDVIEFCEDCKEVTEDFGDGLEIFTTLSECEKFPEFWEKVVEKDYEILSFSHSHGLTTLRNNGYFHKHNNHYVYEKCRPSDCSNDKGATLNEIFNKEEYYDYKIHSVRRLSDGEIFTVGDVIKGFCRKGKITEFKILKGKSNSRHSGRIDTLLEKVDDKIGVIIDNHYIPTELLSELNTKPLFTTEDGVELFEGDSYYRLNANFTIVPLIMCKRFSNSYAGAKFFSTRKSAEEYVLMNKPCLSINDVIFSFNALKLKELVKQKIKKDEENNL